MDVIRKRKAQVITESYKTDSHHIFFFYFFFIFFFFFCLFFFCGKGKRVGAGGRGKLLNSCLKIEDIIKLIGVVLHVKRP